jgi:hypothetical protein
MNKKPRQKNKLNTKNKFLTNHKKLISLNHQMRSMEKETQKATLIRRRLESN